MGQSARATFRVPAELDLAAIDTRGRPVGPRNKGDAGTGLRRRGGAGQRRCGGDSAVTERARSPFDTAGPLRRGAVALALTALLAGCGGGAPPAPSPVPSPPPPPAPSPVSAPPADPPPGAGQSVDSAVCAELPAVAETVRRIDRTAQRGPVAPVAVVLQLLAPRQLAVGANVEDPRLAAALGELRAAIDDVDAQGRAGLPEGGNAVADPVPLDTARLVAAVADLEEICATRG